MAFFDWNHDGKKNYIDNAIEMMILDDLESEEQQQTPITHSRPPKKKKSQEQIDKEFHAITPFFWIIFGFAAIGILLVNVVALFTGYVVWLSFPVSIITLWLIYKSMKKWKVKIKNKV